MKKLTDKEIIAIGTKIAAIVEKLQFHSWRACGVINFPMLNANCKDFPGEDNPRWEDYKVIVEECSKYF